MKNPPESVRIDKWLWAARFFKTRSLAQQQVEGGKVHVNGQRVKASKQVKPGMTIVLRQGYDERTLTVTALSEKRGSAGDAAELYEETAESLGRREATAAQRRADALSRPDPGQRPDKRARRALQQLRTRTTPEE